MKLSCRVALLATALTTMGASAFAQAFNPNTAGERNEDLFEQIEDDAERDLDRFGNEGRPQGFSGSFALRGTATSGNSDDVDLGVGADLLYVFGPNGIDLQMNYSYGESNGVKSDESLIYSLEYTRDITPVVYGFGKVQGAVDEFSTYQSDTFASLGAGYRIFNTPTRQWSVQAGVGYRFANANNILTADFEEMAYGISSDYAHRLTDRLYLTNDTDVISSDSDTALFNDLALSVAMTDRLALRTSILTEYHSDPAPGLEDTDTTFGVSLVVNF